MILVFGKTGQIATELQNSNDVFALGRNQADFSDPLVCAKIVKILSPKAVINAAGYTSVDETEENEELATIINGDTPTSIAKACSELQIPIVHISTDYVFQGSGEIAWKPNDNTLPQNAYGRSKLVGELGIQKTGATHVILRTSWVVSAHGTNFVKTMLRLSKSQNTINIVADQIGGPTPARNVADTCLIIARQLQQDASKSGIYHYSGKPNVSWADFALEIFKQASYSATVIPIASNKFETPVKRPLNSRMDCSMTRSTFGVEQPDWRLELKEILKELKVIK